MMIMGNEGYTKRKDLLRRISSLNKMNLIEDEYVVIKKKSSKDIFHHKESNDESDEENDYAGRKEVLFMEFTEDDEPRQENKEDTNTLSVLT